MQFFLIRLITIKPIIKKFKPYLGSQPLVHHHLPGLSHYQCRHLAANTGSAKSWKEMMDQLSVKIPEKAYFPHRVDCYQGCWLTTDIIYRSFTASRKFVTVWDCLMSCTNWAYRHCLTTTTLDVRKLALSYLVACNKNG